MTAESRLHWLFRVSVLMEFVGHGAFGILTKAGWLPYFATFGIDAPLAYRMMPVIGAVDITLGIVGFVSPRRIVLAHMAFWGLFTAMLRPLAGESFWEVLDRAGNYGVPLAFLLLSGLPRSPREWFEPVTPRSITTGLALVLRWTTALFLLGHGAYGVLLQKPMLIQQYDAIGLAGAAVAPLVGWLEMALGVAVLLHPVWQLLAVVAGLKIATELLYPLTGAPIWEFIERGGTYIAPLALITILPFAQRKRQEGGWAMSTMSMNGREQALLLFASGLFLGLIVGDWTREPTPSPETVRTVVRREKPAHVEPAVEPAIALRPTVAEIRKGGYLLYFRHGQREKWGTAIAFDVFEAATRPDSERAGFRNAVCLSSQGREEAKMVGKLFDLAGIPVGPVVSSPSCRARETAELAFGHVDMVSAGLLHPPVTNPSNAAEFKAELQRILTTVPIVPGKNTVLSAHGNTLRHYRDLFASGQELIPAEGLSETGFYVIRRDPDGALNIVQRFQDLGAFAASAIDLQATSAS